MPTEPQNDRTDRFVVLMTAMQSRLYAFILSLLGDPEQAGDVLQETNLTLWRKSADYEPGTDFAAWACKTAHFQVLAHRQKLGRERLVFGDAILDHLADRATDRGETFDRRRDALHHCLKTLTRRHGDLIERHYSSGQTLDEIAQNLGQSANAIAQALFRARMALLRCIERRTSEDDRS